MKNKAFSLVSHITVFVVIEILFVFAVLHEFPEISLVETIGIVHVSYWIILVVAGFVREKLDKYRQKFLATYIPVVYHIIGHTYVGFLTVDTIQHNAGHDHGLLRMIVATISLGVMIFVGEWLLHRKVHCDTCHDSVHKHCKDK